MPHLVVHAAEDLIEDREAPLIAALTEAVVELYGDWVREQVDVRLIGLSAERWGTGGRRRESPAFAIDYRIHESVFARPDAEQVVASLVARLTDAVVRVLGEPVRPGVSIDLVAVPPGRTAVAGVITA